MANIEHKDTEARMSLTDHLDELRRRIIYALTGLAATMGVCLIFGRQIIEAMKGPYVKVMHQAGLEADLAVLSVPAGFTTYLRVSLYAGIMLAAPWIFYQLWTFVAAGLYRSEKRYVTFAVPLSVGLFICGAAFFLAVVSIPALKFFIGFSTYLGLKPVITLQHYIGFVSRLMLAFGIGFQMPLAILVLGKMHLVSTATLNRYRKHVIVGILLLAAMLTPPDIFSQLALGVPMWLLFELGVLLVYLFATRKSGQEA